MQKKKFLVIFLIIFILFGMLSHSVGVLANEQSDINQNNEIVDNNKNYSRAYLEYLELADEEKSKLDVIPRKYNIPLDSIYEDTIKVKEEPSLFNLYGLRAQTNIVSAFSDELPEQFNLRDEIEIPTKNQNPHGLCWAFSSIRALETNIALQKDEYYDFSELHLGCIKNMLSLTGLEGGGNFSNFFEYCQGNYGPVLESEVPYDAPYDAKYDADYYDYLLSLEAKAYDVEIVNFPNIKFYSPTEDEVQLFQDKIKNHIMKNGSIYASIPSTKLRNVNNNVVLYNNEFYFTDHAISIVGWDDNFLKENFLDQNGNMPKNDGAYIALNSWGENDVFYISYEDFNVSDMSGVKSATTQLSDAKNEIQFKDANLYNELKEILAKNVVEFDDLNLILKCVNLDTITEIDIQGKNIENLSGIEKFTYLTSLNLSNNEISDISVISQLSNLSHIRLENNNIQNISALESLININYLDLSNNEISDISVISQLSNLSHIRLENNNIKNISALGSLTNIKYLNLSGNYIIDGLDNLSYVQELNLDNCNFSNDNLLDLIGIRINSISLQNNNITDASILKDIELTSLDLSGNQNLDINTIPLNRKIISYGSGIVRGGGLDEYHMKLRNCNISNIDVFKNFTGTSLDLSDNPIDDISALKDVYIVMLILENTNISDVSYLNNIYSLNLSKNNNLENLDKLTNTKVLYLEECNIDDLSPLSKLTNIEQLYLNNNNISDVTPLLSLNKLKNLYLSNNNIAIIPDISTLSYLDILDLSNNAIEDITILSNYSGRFDFRSINLNNNKISVIPKYDNNYSLEGQEINQKIDIILNEENIISLPNIIKEAYNENCIYGRDIITNNCEIEFQNDNIIINPDLLGDFTANIQILRGRYKNTKYIINCTVKETLNFEKIEIVSLPERLVYLEGEDFDSAGMVVRAIDENGITKTIKDYLVIGGENLQKGQEYITIKYGDFEQNINISVMEESRTTKIEFSDVALFNEICNYLKNEDILNYNKNNSLTIIIETEILEGINNLSINSEEISDLTGLSNFYNLVNLELFNTKVEDVTEIGGLTKLERLYLHNNCMIKDIKSFQSLENLRDISLINTYLEGDLSIVEELPNITSITITQIENLDYYDIIKNSKRELPMYILDTEQFQNTKTLEAEISYNWNGAVQKELQVFTDKNDNPYIILDTEISLEKPEGQRRISIEVIDGTIVKEYIVFYKVSKILDRIEVTREPNKLSYAVGQIFDNEGMVVTARYNDGTEIPITDYTIIDGEYLTEGKINVKIQYTENGITRTTEQSINVYGESELINIQFPDENFYNAIKDKSAFENCGMNVHRKLIVDNNDVDNTVLMVKEIVEQVDYIFLMQKDVRDITGIENFINLVSVDLSFNNNLQQVDKLLLLNKIKWIQIHATKVENIEDLLNKESVTKITLRKKDQNVINSSMTEVILPQFIYQSLTMQENVSAEAYIYYSTYALEDGYHNELDGEKELTQVSIDTEKGIATAKLDKELTQENGVGIRGIEVQIKGGKTDGALYIAFYNNLERISIVSAPKKVNYIVGQNFDTEGMIVSATYKDETTTEISDYKVLNGENLLEGQENVIISYTENGITKEINQSITVVPEEKLEINIEEYQIEQDGEIKYINNINPETKISQVLEKIQVNTETTKKVFKKETEIKDFEQVATTGMTIQILFREETVEYTAIVSGDINGDGMITATDLTRMKNHILEKTTLSNIGLKASDLNNDSQITATELTKIKKYVLGMDIDLP